MTHSQIEPIRQLWSYIATTRHYHLVDDDLYQHHPLRCCSNGPITMTIMALTLGSCWRCCVSEDHFTGDDHWHFADKRPPFGPHDGTCTIVARWWWTYDCHSFECLACKLDLASGDVAHVWDVGVVYLLITANNEPLWRIAQSNMTNHSYCSSRENTVNGGEWGCQSVTRIGLTADVCVCERLHPPPHLLPGQNVSKCVPLII